MTIAGSLKAKLSSRRRRAPVEDKLAILEKEEKQEEEEEEGENSRAPGSLPPEEGAAGASKKVSFAILSEKYEPLGGWAGEKETPPPPPEQEARQGKKRKRKLRKYGKNVGKAVRKGCRYLVLGLQGLANAYSSPLGVAVSISTAFR
ncbi:hypothetical protein JRQ81_004745 [Phrynocephalus forsythii]|uniref:Uncharacterized protein n=1 Tax=Phrynocephalus forsythii TaxID=171643 RepID=A0A9Q0Y2Z6_9SAUR|nr:hypothetical protein JRQ81_004745 [Phrynocephalus forsythii]